MTTLPQSGVKRRPWSLTPGRRARFILPVILPGVFLFALASALVSQAPLASAQSTDLQGLVDQVERLQRELITLQRHVYSGGPAPQGGAEGVVTSDAQAARMELRLSELDRALRALTGQVEQQSHRINQMASRLDRLVADVDNRLQQIEQQVGLGGVAAGQQGTPPSGGQTALNQPAAQGQTASGQGVIGSGSTAVNEPGTIGTITPEALAAVEAGSAGAGSTQVATAAVGGQAGGQASGQALGTPQEQYNAAFRLLSQTKYAEAEQALTQFLAQNPEDPLAGNAKYWLGETYYVRGQFAQAAVTFAEGYQDYPNSAKAPDNLLKLGKALGELGQDSDACATLGELLQRFPTAPAPILQQAKQDRQRLTCG